MPKRKTKLASKPAKKSARRSKPSTKPLKATKPAPKKKAPDPETLGLCKTQSR